jgi:hypothetical protein
MMEMSLFMILLHKLGLMEKVVEAEMAYSDLNMGMHLLMESALQQALPLKKKYLYLKQVYLPVIIILIGVLKV